MPRDHFDGWKAASDCLDDLKATLAAPLDERTDPGLKRDAGEIGLRIEKGEPDTNLNWIAISRELKQIIETMV